MIFSGTLTVPVSSPLDLKVILDSSASGATQIWIILAMNVSYLIIHLQDIAFY